MSKVTYPGGSTLTYAYDEMGNTKNVVNANAVLWYEYDARNRMTKESQNTASIGGANRTTTYTYDGASNLATMTYPDGTVSTYAPDNFNRVSNVQVGGGTLASFAYRTDDRISSVGFGNGVSTTFAYDNRARPDLLTTNPGTTTQTIRPMASGDSTQWSRNGGTANWDRVAETTSDGDTTYVYASSGTPLDLYHLGDLAPLNGAAIQSVAVTAVAKYIEDDPPPPPPAPQCSDGIDNDFDGLIDYPKDPGCTSSSDNSEFNPSAPSGTGTCTRRSFNPCPESTPESPSPLDSGNFYLAVKTGGQTYTSSVQYPGSGYGARTWTMTTNPATGTAWTEADVNALQAGVKLGSTTSQLRVTQVYVTVTTTSSMRLTLDYAYNGAGDVVSLAVTPPTGSAVIETYAYDGQDRLRRWTASGGATFAHDYGYNAAGDRTSLTDGSDAWTYAHTGDHRLSKNSKPNWAWSLAYDGNGNGRWRNQTLGGTTKYEYVYDAEDRLTTVKQNGGTIATYAYDGLGRRVKAVEGGTTFLVYSGLSLVQTVAGSTVTRYVYASGLLVARIAAGVTTYVHPDALGSVRATSDGNGHWVTSTQYKPFGQEYATQGSSGPLRYTGQQKDSTGLYYLYRRFYDPDLGRFLSQDVMLGHLTVPQSLARYTYTVNNPLRYVDPTGEDWWNPLSWVRTVLGESGWRDSSPIPLEPGEDLSSPPNRHAPYTPENEQILVARDEAVHTGRDRARQDGDILSIPYR